MGSLSGSTRTATATHAPLLNTKQPLRRTTFNQLFAAVYTFAILALVYHHLQTLVHCTTLTSFSVSLSLFFSDIVLAFMWVSAQCFRMRPIHRKEYPENLAQFMKPSDFPALDVFVCTADPYKEPPMNVLNTALSVMAYDYPPEKISVYVSDDGGSALTLFAFMEAAKFASHWLPFCRKNRIMERSPDAYFKSNVSWCPEIENMKIMYESMRMRVENVVHTGGVSDEYITGDEEREAFNKWTDGFTRQDHPTVIQVLLENSRDRDITGHLMPSLIYVSRQKSKTSPHNFKAGALNSLLRVSATMTNAPIILTLDCDTCSNDPQTPLRVLCYVFDPAIRPTLAFVQFPQRFRGLNKNDIYACEIKRAYEINSLGIDGLIGPNYLGTGTFFCRRAFFGNPSTLISPEIPELHLDHVVDKPIKSPSILSLAHHVAGCNYENQTNWGSKMGFRYGTLVEDFYTEYMMRCEGWRSVFCHPQRSAFYGDAPITMTDMLNQNKRWFIGFLEVAFCKYSPLTFGIRRMGLSSLCYVHYSLWAIWAIPIMVYAFLPQLTLLNGVSILPKVSEPWFALYSFLFIGAYGQDFLEYMLEGSTFGKWWNDQRIWMIRGTSCFLFGITEYLLKCIGISALGFGVTSKVLDAEQSKRYEQGIFEFGVPSPMFVPLTTAAVINLASFLRGLLEIISGTNKDGLFVQMLLAGFLMVNCWPIYEAMVWRSDKGKMPTKITVISTFMASALFAASSLIFK